MNVTDEQLMAFVDGELDADASAAIEREIEKDSALAKKVERQRALRKQLSGHFDPILQEPIPDKLAAMVRDENASTVTELSAIREKRNARGRLAGWLPIAASIVFGVLIGFVAFRGDRSAIVANTDGVIAQGKLAIALTEEIASRPAQDLSVRIGVTYATNSGDYCRTFVVADERSVAGVACRTNVAANAVWRIRVLVPVDSNSDANYRTAATTMPAQVLDQVSKDIKGDPFDAEEEAQIVSRGWTSR